MMKKRGIRQAVFSPEVDSARWLRYDTAAFCRRLLPQILSWALSKRECTRAGIFAQEGDFWTQRAARLLAGASRYLFLACGEEEEMLSFALRREFGIAAVTGATARQLSECDVLLLLSPWKAERCPGITLPFYSGGERPWQYCFPEMEQFPAEVREQLAAALFEMGVLREKDVQII